MNRRLEGSRVRTAILVCMILGGATLLRTLWLTADPPTSSVGIVWHDEGAWVHNARNQALWGVWRTDNWNPVFVAPVFTALQYAAFELFGVGTWQARTVPVASGLVALVMLMAGMHALAGRRTALLAGALLAVNYTWVMWNRAALMESTMTAFIVVGWAAYALAARRPVLGLAAGIATTLAWFTKAAAAFFVAALVIDAAWTLISSAAARRRTSASDPLPPDPAVRGAWWTLAGLAASAAAIGVAFVLPNWSEYAFYNWAMSVERKPAYDVASLADRASWIPVVHDFFTRMWLELVLAALAMLSIVIRWKTARPAERLLALWVLVGFAELTVHDSGNERRYVMFVPVIVALASLHLSTASAWLPREALDLTRRGRWLLLPLLLGLAYVVAGSALAPALITDRTAEHPYRLAVRVSAAAAVAGVLFALLRWNRIVPRLSRLVVPAAAGMAVLVIVGAWNGWQYVSWAAQRGTLNHDASVEIGRLLPPNTMVHGKLANGLALENHIRPIFIGNGFGNFADRFERDDARYVLTYRLPEEGYESQRGLIAEILARYPGRGIVATFPVDETPGPDEAVLIDKRPDGPPLRAPD